MMGMGGGTFLYLFFHMPNVERGDLFLDLFFYMPQIWVGCAWNVLYLFSSSQKYEGGEGGIIYVYFFYKQVGGWGVQWCNLYRPVHTAALIFKEKQRISQQVRIKCDICWAVGSCDEKLILMEGLGLGVESDFVPKGEQD